MKKVKKSDRLIPKGGLGIYCTKDQPQIWYYDSNDMPDEYRREQFQFFQDDSVYKVNRSRYLKINRGEQNRKFRVYVFKKDDPIAIIVLNENLNNPLGYGRNDFDHWKWVYPRYRNTKHSKYAMGDLIHMMFMSEVADLLYTYVPSVKGTTGTNFFERVDRGAPCVGKVFSSDGPQTQKYITVRHNITIDEKDFIIVEYNGNIYRSMDRMAYFMAPPGREEASVIKMMEEMDRAAQKVKEMML